MLIGVSAGIVMGVPAFSFCQRGENDFTAATRFARCWSVSGRHDGMLVVSKPRVTALNKSSSVGNVPVGVERHLKDGER